MRVYLETSLFGFWYDVHQRNLKSRRHVRRILLSCRKGKGIHRGFVSAVVFAELEESREPYKRRDLGLLGKIDPETVTADPEQFERLVEAYEAEPRLSRIPERDRMHLALYTLSDLDWLITMDLKDFTRPVMLEAVVKVNHAQGIYKAVKIGSPETFFAST